MADDAGARSFVVGRHMEFLHPVQHGLQDLPVLLRPQKAVFAGDDAVGPDGIKPCDRLPRLIRPHRELGFVPVAEGILHTPDGMAVHARQVQAADAPEIV